MDSILMEELLEVLEPSPQNPNDHWSFAKGGAPVMGVVWPRGGRERTGVPVFGHRNQLADI